MRDDHICRYFHLIDGVLVCDRCGKLIEKEQAKAAEKPEDKAVKQVENKAASKPAAAKKKAPKK